MTAFFQYIISNCELIIQLFDNVKLTKNITLSHGGIAPQETNGEVRSSFWEGVRSSLWEVRSSLGGRSSLGVRSHSTVEERTIYKIRVNCSLTAQILPMI